VPGRQDQLNTQSDAELPSRWWAGSKPVAGARAVICTAQGRCRLSRSRRLGGLLQPYHYLILRLLIELLLRRWQASGLVNLRGGSLVGAAPYRRLAPPPWRLVSSALTTHCSLGLVRGSYLKHILERRHGLVLTDPCNLGSQEDINEVEQRMRREHRCV
jgi:hypothetical protein